MTVGLESVALPDFGVPGEAPEIPHATYADRLVRFPERMSERGYDAAVVYADREHSANLSYLTGFDPRFEEALLIVSPDSTPLLLTGNECVGMAEAAPVEMQVELHQEFSLPGQPRDRSRDLVDVMRENVIGPDGRIAVLGWKQISNRAMIEVPAFIVDALREAVGPDGAVENANEMLTDAESGLRVINEPEQLAAFEHASCHTSSAVGRLLAGLRPGMREFEAVRLLEWNGSPLSCHLMLTSGPRASLGLLGPSDRRIERGDRFTTAYGIWGLSTVGPDSSSSMSPSCPVASQTTSTASSVRTSPRSSSGTRRCMSARRWQAVRDHRSPPR